MKKFKTNPFLVIKQHKKYGFILEDFFLKKSYQFDLIYIPLLIYTLSEKTFEDILIFSSKINISNDFLKKIIASNLLVLNSDKISKLNKVAEKWREYNHTDSLYYHISAFNYPFINYTEPIAGSIDKSLMDIYRKINNLPSPYKNYPRKKFFKLKIPEYFPDVSSDKILLGKTFLYDNSFLEKFNIFLFTSFGKVKEVRYLGTRKFYRTAPSGGGKHPTEVYIFLLKKISNDLVPGIYHYNVKKHGLDLIRKGNYQKLFLDCNYGEFKNKINNKKLVFGLIYTSVIERAMWRYRDIRSTRAIFADIGHLAQVAKYNAIGTGFESISEYNFNEMLLEGLLGINSRELILYSQAYYI